MSALRIIGRSTFAGTVWQVWCGTRKLGTYYNAGEAQARIDAERRKGMAS